MVMMLFFLLTVRLQHIMDHFSQACSAFGLNISRKKTKVMFTPVLGKPYIEPNITVNIARLNVVEIFVYLGNTITRDDSLDAEIYSRISKTSLAFGKLEKRIWADRDITISTKIGVYRTCYNGNALFSWNMDHRQKTYQIVWTLPSSLRCIMNIKWQTDSPDTIVLEKAECPNIE